MDVGVGQILTGKIFHRTHPQTLHASVEVASGEVAALVVHYSGLLSLCCCPALYCYSSIVLANCVYCKHTSKYQLT